MFIIPTGSERWALELIRDMLIETANRYEVDVVELARGAQKATGIVDDKGKCGLWPDCPCGEAWRFWAEELGRWHEAAPTTQEVRWAVTAVSRMLACVSRNCPDEEFREAAARQWRLVGEIRAREEIEG
jgi:hypothetical protein